MYEKALVNMAQTDSSFTLKHDVEQSDLSECYAILLIHHHHYKADVEQFTSAGLPSFYARANRPINSQSSASIFGGRKRLQVQFPLLTLQRAKIDRKQDILSIEDVQKRRDQAKGSTTGRRVTMFDVMEPDLVGVQSKRVMDIALTMLFQGQDLRSPTLYYPKRNILAIPRWCSQSTAYVSSKAQWATLSFLSPSTLKSSEEDETSVESEKRFLSSLKEKKETIEQAMDRFFVPDQESETMMNTLLLHLESRGVIWTKIGRVTKPSIKNFRPQLRPEFTVLGLFPEPFVDRCRSHYRRGKAMPADVTEPDNSKHAPLIVSTSKDQTTALKDDFLRDWTVRTVTYEPFHTGSPWEDSSSAYFAAAAGIQ